MLIGITYVTELAFDDGDWLKFHLKSHPFPPDGLKSTHFVHPTNILGTYHKQVGYGLKVSFERQDLALNSQIEIEMEMSSGIKSVSSPSHPISFEFGRTPQQANIRLAKEDGTPLIHDFELIVSLHDPHT